MHLKKKSGTDFNSPGLTQLSLWKIKLEKNKKSQDIIV